MNPCKGTTISTSPQERIHIGWASTSITPVQPVQLAGQHYARISEGIIDPVMATVLALSSGSGTGGATVLVSCDLVAISDSLWAKVRERAKAVLPELDPGVIIMNATHTHSAPMPRPSADERNRVGTGVNAGEIELPAMDVGEYIEWAAGQIAGAIASAWQARRPGSVGYGLGQAVVGRNRRSRYEDGRSQMYGNTAQDDFSHIEGYEDHSVNLLGTWDEKGTLTGLVVNVPCPSQLSEHIYEVSADYWHDTRVELRRRLGEGLFVLPQCSAAGDQSPHVQWDTAAEEWMRRLSGRTQRQDIAIRIADAVSTTLPLMEKDRQGAPVLRHHGETVELSRRRLSQQDVAEALAEAEPHRVKYEQLLAGLEAHPEIREQPRWYKDITFAYRKWSWSHNVERRYEIEQAQPRYPVELHVVRIGEIAMTTNPFELYLDYGIRIKARSPYRQTFVIQLSGSGSYLPSERSIAGKGYGSVPASSVVGPEGGRELVEWTLMAAQKLWG